MGARGVAAWVFIEIGKCENYKDLETLKTNLRQIGNILHDLYDLNPDYIKEYQTGKLALTRMGP